MNKSDVTKTMLENLSKKFNAHLVDPKQPLPTGKKRGETKDMLEKEIVGAANELLQPGDEKLFDAEDIELMTVIGIDFAGLTGMTAENGYEEVNEGGGECLPCPPCEDAEAATDEETGEEAIDDKQQANEGDDMPPEPEAVETPSPVVEEQKKRGRGKKKADSASASPKAEKAPKTPKENQKSKIQEQIQTLTTYIEESKYTRKEILDDLKKKMPNENMKPYQNHLSEGKNSKYNRFAKLVVQADNGILSFQ